ncbi:exported hypothetical protein [Mesorhizobium plurifarium]|uniref:Lipoprotein n=1 Tax=Mesorhizobium plurifarium TaxID=69974 RepID=A0A090DV89_MESPL|nr:exported hypothetical protein [Mesorhizobium plurifarium]
MKIPLIFLTMILALLTACQTIPAVRKNNCACAWDKLAFQSEGVVS